MLKIPPFISGQYDKRIKLLIFVFRIHLKFKSEQFNSPQLQKVFLNKFVYAQRKLLILFSHTVFQ
jgi:hypothetical protein